jgi:hypothetical protein
MLKIKSVHLHNALRSGEHVGHPIYFALVAAFGHGPYALAAGVMAFITLLLIFIVAGD